MLRLVLIFCGLTVIGCANRSNTHVTPAPDRPLTNPPQITEGAEKPILAPSVVKIVPPQKKIALAHHRTSRNGVILSMVSFDGRKHQLRVADQQNGLGSRWIDAKSAATTYRGLAAINGGFFTPEGKPLGLVIETGTKRGYINKSSLGAGMFVSSKAGSAIIRREQYRSSSIAHTTSFKQALCLLKEPGPSLAYHKQVADPAVSSHGMERITGQSDTPSPAPLTLCREL
jgi:uncharacterized protein YigE (DUF2233 family)